MTSNVKERVAALTSATTAQQPAVIHERSSDLEQLNQATARRRHNVAFGHLDLGSEIEYHIARARRLRSAYCSHLMLRVWDCATLRLGKHIRRKERPDTTMGHLHRTGS